MRYQPPLLRPSSTVFRYRGAMSVTALIVVLIVPGTALAQDSREPIPRVHKDGPSLRFDFPALKIGIAEYEEGPTGTTVFYFPHSVKAAVDVRGGAPGTVNATALMNSKDYAMMDAVVFSGGSWYGLSAATGVANGIKEEEAAAGDVDFIAGVVASRRSRSWGGPCARRIHGRGRGRGQIGIRPGAGEFRRPFQLFHRNPRWRQRLYRL